MIFNSQSKPQGSPVTLLGLGEVQASNACSGENFYTKRSKSGIGHEISNDSYSGRLPRFTEWKQKIIARASGNSLLPILNSHRQYSTAFSITNFHVMHHICMGSRRFSLVRWRPKSGQIYISTLMVHENPAKAGRSTMPSCGGTEGPVSLFILWWHQCRVNGRRAEHSCAERC